jgi:formylglycine-generating enzyme required for sulfatase activity
MGKIFISYRRDDSEGEAGRLFDDLVKRFGEASVFMDVTGIQAGRDFRKVIEESVSTCGVLLAVIGKSWLEVKNEAGKRRLDDPLDFVRLETAHALQRDIPVIPVLVHGASMPTPEQLPDDLRDLHFRNCCEVTHARWSSDIEVLVKALRGFLEPPPSVVVPKRPPRRKAVLVAAAAVIAILLIAGVLMLYRKGTATVAPPIQDANKSVPVLTTPFTAEPEMVQIPAGTFAMGSPSTENGRKENEGPLHQVSVPAFELGKVEVSVEQFQAFVNENPDLLAGAAPCSTWKGHWQADKTLSWTSPGFTQSSKNPAVCVSWLDAQHYVDWLNKKSPGKTYRLPSESEWEYAARATSTGPRYWPAEEEPCHYAVTAIVSAECQAFGHTMPVGERLENNFHLFDVLGNASEWTEDCYNTAYTGAPTNGEVWKSGNCNLRVVRGGSWMHGLAEVRSAFRTGFAPSFRSDQIGFRVARTLP